MISLRQSWRRQCKNVTGSAFFKVEVVEEIASANEKISSTRIEQSIKRGEMEETADIMGRFYEMRGIVKSGNRVGRKYGFPTANLKHRVNISCQSRVFILEVCLY